VYNIRAMDHPSLKPDNSILFKNSILIKIRNREINDFEVEELTIENVKKTMINLKNKSVVLKRTFFGEKEGYFSIFKMETRICYIQD